MPLIKKKLYDSINWKCYLWFTRNSQFWDCALPVNN